MHEGDAGDRRVKRPRAPEKRIPWRKKTNPLPDEQRVISAGGYRDGRIKGLILDLAAPRAGERLLDIGCRSGDHLLLFHKKGCDVTGIDPSPLHLDLARQRLGQRAELREGRAEDLPFSDNEFDLVTLITSLEFTDDPGQAVAEAIRVCRGRLFIGVMNRFSLIGLQGKLMPSLRPAAARAGPFLPSFRSPCPDPQTASGGPDPVGKRPFSPLGLVRFRRRHRGAAPRHEQPLRGLSRPFRLRQLLLPDNPGGHPGAGGPRRRNRRAAAEVVRGVEAWFMKRCFTKRRRTASSRCGLCAHRCRIAPGARGVCGVRREPTRGSSYSLVYGTVIAENIDPIEKKPFFHLPARFPLLLHRHGGLQLPLRLLPESRDLAAAAGRRPNRRP